MHPPHHHGNSVTAPEKAPETAVIPEHFYSFRPTNRTCPLIAYFATFDASALFGLTLYLPAKVARSLQYHAVVADHATVFSRPVRHRLCVRGNRLAWLSSAHTDQYSGVGSAARSFDEWCSTVLAIHALLESLWMGSRDVLALRRLTTTAAMPLSNRSLGLTLDGLHSLVGGLPADSQILG
jgi:hypothetical protein